MNVNMSPYYTIDQYSAAKVGDSGGVGLAKTHLCLAFGEELQRIDSIGDSAADDRQPVEHHRRLTQILEEYLPNEIP